MTHIYKSFTFINDSEGAEKCSRENPDATIIQLKIVNPPRCEHKPCKSPGCTCPQNYRVPLAEQNIQDMPYRWMLTRWEDPA